MESNEKGTHGGTNARQATGFSEESVGYGKVVSASGGKQRMTQKSPSPERNGNNGGGGRHDCGDHDDHDDHDDQS